MIDMLPSKERQKEILQQATSHALRRGWDEEALATVLGVSVEDYRQVLTEGTDDLVLWQQIAVHLRR